MSNSSYLKKKKNTPVFQNDVTTATLTNNNSFIIVVRCIPYDVIAYFIRPIFRSFMAQKNSTSYEGKYILQMSGKSKFVHLLYVSTVCVFSMIFLKISQIFMPIKIVCHTKKLKTLVCV